MIDAFYFNIKGMQMKVAIVGSDYAGRAVLLCIKCSCCYNEFCSKVTNYGVENEGSDNRSRTFRSCMCI